jgi:predicted DNA-binding protein with PD1-like motif
MQTIAVRLYPNQDLRHHLSSMAMEHQIQAGCILSAIGSLTQATLRFADQADVTVLSGPFEILSLNGTLSVYGIHLHMAIARSNGEVIGGHVSNGCIIYTTGELVIGLLDGVKFRREPDPQTGFKELQIRPLVE